jgi:hypothetical protein
MPSAVIDGTSMANRGWKLLRDRMATDYSSSYRRLHQVVEEDGSLGWSEVYLFPHFQTSGVNAFLRITTAANATVLCNILGLFCAASAAQSVLQLGCHRLFAAHVSQAASIAATPVLFPADHALSRPLPSGCAAQGRCFHAALSCASGTCDARDAAVATHR